MKKISIDILQDNLLIATIEFEAENSAMTNLFAVKLKNQNYGYLIQTLLSSFRGVNGIRVYSLKEDGLPKGAWGGISLNEVVYNAKRALVQRILKANNLEIVIPDFPVSFYAKAEYVEGRIY